MYAIPLEKDLRKMLQMVPQEVLSRAFTASGLPYTDALNDVPSPDLERLVDTAREFLVMGPAWNRPSSI